MVSYTQKDVKIVVDGADLFCESAAIKYSADITPKSDVLGRSVLSFAAGGPTNGAFDISYPLTGADPISSKMNNEKTPVTLSFGGITVHSGYLDSYSFDCQAFKPVIVNATFNFYNGVSGNFVGASSSVAGADPLVVSDMSLDNGTVVTADKIRSIKYTFNSEISPRYVVQDTFNLSGVIPEGVNSADKRVDASVTLYDYDMSLPATGLNESFTFNFKDKNNNSKQSYYIDGQINSKVISSKVADVMTSDYSISQGKLGGPQVTEITTITPTAGDPGSTILLLGEGFDNPIMGYIGEYECKISGSVGAVGSSDSVNIVVNPEIVSGFKAGVAIATANGFHRSTVAFTASSGLSL